MTSLYLFLKGKKQTKPRNTKHWNNLVNQVKLWSLGAEGTAKNKGTTWPLGTELSGNRPGWVHCGEESVLTGTTWEGRREKRSRESQPKGRHGSLGRLGRRPPPASRLQALSNHPSPSRLPHSHPRSCAGPSSWCAHLCALSLFSLLTPTLREVPTHPLPFTTGFPSVMSSAPSTVSWWLRPAEDCPVHLAADLTLPWCRADEARCHGQALCPTASCSGLALCNVTAEMTCSTACARPEVLPWSRAAVCGTPVWAAPRKPWPLLTGATLERLVVVLHEAVFWVRYGRDTVMLQLLCQPGEEKRVCSPHGSLNLLPAS